MGTDRSARAEHPQADSRCRGRAVVRCKWLIRVDFRGPVSTAGLSSPQGEPTWWVESVSGGWAETPGHPRCRPAFCRSWGSGVHKVPGTLPAERGGGDFKILFAELSEAWLPQLSGIPQGTGGTDRGSVGWGSLSSDVKWRPRAGGTLHLVGSFLLPGKCLVHLHLT